MVFKVVIIFGFLSGIGFVSVFIFVKDIKKCFRVYVMMRNLEKKGQLVDEGKVFFGDMLIIKQMDVCLDELVEKIVREVIDEEGRIDVICE